jgi:LPXTG-motif cell wall-anchored protein
MSETGEEPLNNNNLEEFNSGDDGLELYDAFDDDILERDSTGGRTADKGGHKFIIFAGFLGVVIIIVLIALVIYGGIMQPQQTMANTQVAAEVRAQNTITALMATSFAGTKTAIAEEVVNKQSEMSLTPSKTVEVIEVEEKAISTETATRAASNTPLPAVTETTSSAKLMVDDQSPEHTATVAALLTLSAADKQSTAEQAATGPVIKLEAMTSTPEVTATGDVVETSLPETGLIDNIGLMSMLGGAVLLLGVIIIARRLRRS